MPGALLTNWCVQVILYCGTLKRQTFMGDFIDIAVVDAYGKVLLDQPVRPGCLITPGAYDIHGIRDENFSLIPNFL